AELRGPPDIISLVPVGPKYTVKWTAPLLQVKVVEVGQETSQSKEKLYQHCGSKQAGNAGVSGERGGQGGALE
ncbi:hypothetical protein Z043_108867, partial [Scleropages formosus]